MAYLLHHLLTESAAKYPEREALRFQGTAVTYQQLEGYTNQVSRVLQQAGVGRGDRVGFFLNKSPASVVSIYGIMKAGGAYVPLDPSAPAKRHAYITRNCEIKVLLTSSDKLPVVAQFFEKGKPLTHIILLDEGAVSEGVALPDSVRVLSWADVAAEKAAENFQRQGEPDPAGERGLISPE